MIEYLLSAAMAIGPALGYIDQYFIIKRQQSSSGFNPVTCAILLFSNIVRIFFWFGKRFDTTLLIQSAVMIITQSILLETVVRHRTPEKHESEPLKDQEQRRLRWYDTFWQWPHYLDYVNCLLGFTTVVGVAYVLLGKLPWFVEALGIISLGIESTLPLPQCISNFKTRSTAGFSLIVLATWFLGDAFKLFYFIYTNAPLQFDLCGAIQLSIDSLIVMQSILFSTKVKTWLGIHHPHPDKHFYASIP
ncbi:hypothetical protein O0I10_003660 [Lichtheimia ornata]|uniref:PQ-loop repeat-containing protein 1 n=1 Tax=Lichtheimia ornata TaxID=688661 RepID=A0AAD7V7W4_9FUNG|nr:uncharacterized protein O0I10_003660 [Lichtheimia ornata]KAJ8660612.1 hypothetical protein O0I10_003660 [Lichtheimia ornata]